MGDRAAVALGVDVGEGVIAALAVGRSTPVAAGSDGALTPLQPSTAADRATRLINRIERECIEATSQAEMPL